MTQNYSFEFDPKYSDHIKTKFSLRIECEISKDENQEIDSKFKVINQDDNSEIDIKTLDLRDRAEIGHRAHSPPQRIIDAIYEARYEKQ